MLHFLGTLLYYTIIYYLCLYLLHRYYDKKHTTDDETRQETRQENTWAFFTGSLLYFFAVLPITIFFGYATMSIICIPITGYFTAWLFIRKTKRDVKMFTKFKLILFAIIFASSFIICGSINYYKTQINNEDNIPYTEKSPIPEQITTDNINEEIYEDGW